VRDALPNASYIGFTGTPIEKEDKSTPAVFGDYIYIYDIKQSVDDGATVPISYESLYSLTQILRVIPTIIALPSNTFCRASKWSTTSLATS
jgi:type I site-specific restriction-modification system R (restriction) subunit